ncbi:histone-like nucleoid-structuring protein Lsr2 [Microbacterium halotolerans]|uniref:histone-like nucleoid-structuring protein Lsr2 n=1 Tax=Microbacterium halotolerans TaxID=246613 RepID=UPI000E6A9E7F|nr:Lsr2 family protein [Microbacterium halotolerans]
MATRYIVVSDLSGEYEAESVRVGFDGTWYELDATESERVELEKTLRPYLQVGRKSTSTSSRTPTARVVPPMRHRERAAIREWARGQGFTIADRGRIPYRIWRAYQEAAVTVQ